MYTEQHAEFIWQQKKSGSKTAADMETQQFYWYIIKQKTKWSQGLKV
jgi:hypothetical protein